MKIQKWDEINGTGSSRERMEAFLNAEMDSSGRQNNAVSV